MDESLKDRLVSEYLAREPTVENSRAIVRELAELHGLSEAKLRSALVSREVYVSQPRAARIASPEQKQAIFERLDAAPEGEAPFSFELAKEFNLTWNAVFEVERQWREERNQWRSILSHQGRQRSGGMKYIMFGAIALIPIILLVVFMGAVPPTSRDVAVDVSAPDDTTGSGTSTFQGTASDAERRAYSADLYDSPSGLNAEQEQRYENLTPEGREYVDEMMSRYDEVCAQSSEC